MTMEWRRLTDAMPSNAALDALEKLARKKCYCAPEVVQLELAGYEALRGLPECFVPAALAVDDVKDERTRTTRSLLLSQGVGLDEAPGYDRIMRGVDFVSGMTDRYALAMDRRIKGISDLHGLAYPYWNARRDMTTRATLKEST